MNDQDAQELIKQWPSLINLMFNLAKQLTKDTGADYATFEQKNEKGQSIAVIVAAVTPDGSKKLLAALEAAEEDGSIESDDLLEL